MELYIPDGRDKNVRHRVVCENIVLCKPSGADKSILYMSDNSHYSIPNSLKVIYDFYFSKNPSFILAKDAIINKQYIITAILQQYDGAIKLVLQKNHTAWLMRSHPYAYFIMNGEHKTKRAGAAQHSEVKDKIIMSDTKNVQDVIREIHDATGEVVTSRYIIKRYKQLKINQ